MGPKEVIRAELLNESGPGRMVARYRIASSPP